MKMARTTRTIHPLHFEDLDAHRFEDLVRQLIYDFREWRSLEATGRTGSDEGFDVRAIEVVQDIEYESDDEDELHSAQRIERLWLVQCKREKSITPKKLDSYVNEVLGPHDNIYGIIFAASCDFSKKSRDTFLSICREKGIDECYLWGKADLEDMLIQPKNDHLLFAYFGFSLSYRKRSLKTQINSLLAIKRKSSSVLGDIRAHNFKPILLRDPEETNYPKKKKVPDFDKHPTWRSYYFMGHKHDGLIFQTRKYFAYIDDDQIHWDCIEKFDESRPNNLRWREKIDEGRENAHQLWLGLDEKNRGWLEIQRVVLYSNVLAIDELGDEVYEMPHIYVHFDYENGPFEPYCYLDLRSMGPDGAQIGADRDNQIEYFPKEFESNGSEGEA